MRFGINLRGDLAKLDDIEIATRFEKLIADREAMYRALPNHGFEKFFYQRGLTFWFGRGPLHARKFYEILGILMTGPPMPFLGNRPFYELYLLDCEVKDVRDEIRRRVERQKGVPAG